MGFKQAAVLAPVCFFLGVLFICINVDYRLLWGDVTEEVIKDGFQFYKTFFNAPPAIKALLHGMIGVGLLGFFAKLFKWDESAVYFDGSSLAVYVFAIVVYLTVTINSLRAIADPVPNVDTPDDQVMALRVLSAGNAGQEYAFRSEAKAVAQWEAEQRKKTTEEKKEQ
ncbi:hypothetical protein CVT24_004886 [Panaeolus cyanescens]|uniref:Shr3 amino acid permease chaperone n=1 Tax=Panaeolus cyanescens TaxID=181874 RepID=A0A409W258_9AGAR|nr:hypothetical protein CVT24_004886 [Panaeolus cyanescens]